MKKNYSAPTVAIDSIALQIQVMNLTSSTVNHNGANGQGGDAPKRKISTMYI